MSQTLDKIGTDLRDRAVQAAKRHKASWLELGQYLYGIYKDKLYRSWGFLNFETYCMKELSLKQTTAVKLLKSYYFVEQEEPQLLKAKDREDGLPKNIPSCDSVNLLRLAKNNKKINSGDFNELRTAVLDNGREAVEVRAQVRKMMSERDERDPKEVRRERRQEAIKRLIRVLSQAKQDFEAGSLLPPYLIQQITSLTEKLQDQLES